MVSSNVNGIELSGEWRDASFVRPTVDLPASKMKVVQGSKTPWEYHVIVCDGGLGREVKDGLFTADAWGAILKLSGVSGEFFDRSAARNLADGIRRGLRIEPEFAFGEQADNLLALIGYGRGLKISKRRATLSKL